MQKIKLQDITAARHAPEDQEQAPALASGQVGPGRWVTMHFELILGDGSIVDSNFDASPVVFCVGDGNILAGFEEAIYGLRAGQESTVQITADRAFGQVNPGNIQRFPRYRFPADLAMESGLVLNFTDSAGNDQPGVVTAVDASQVTVDFNHPLAGKDILFRVRILDVSDSDSD